MEGELGRHEYAASGDFHHAAGEQGADDDAQGGHQYDRPARRGLGTDGGVQEVGGVIGDPDDEVKAGEHQNQPYDEVIDWVHKRNKRPSITGGRFRTPVLKREHSVTLMQQYDFQ